MIDAHAATGTLSPPRYRRPGFRVSLPPGLVAIVFVLAIVAGDTGFLGTTRDAALWLRDFALRSNLHEVVPGEFYRSAQMSHESLARTIEKHGIATVVDLRNGLPDPDEHGRTEPEVVAAAGATYVHVPMLTSNLPPKERLLQLIAVFATAERPILVHCSSGALRTGVASAIWMLTEEQESLAEARDQLQIRYGYTSLETEIRRWKHGFDPLVSVLDFYADALANGPTSFRDWIEAGSNGTNAAGVYRFYPPGHEPGHS